MRKSIDKYCQDEKLYGVSAKRIHKQDMHDLIRKIQSSVNCLLDKESEVTQEKVEQVIWRTILHNLGDHNYCSDEYCSNEASIVNFNEQMTQEYLVETMRRCLQKININNFCQSIVNSGSTR